MNKQREEYKDKLRQFNSTAKYKTELDFLTRLINPLLGEKILDYGCGLGTAVRHLGTHSGADCFGYDVVNYREKDDLFLFRNQYFFKFSKIFFLHSLAHIPEIEWKLQDLKELLAPEAKVYVITPNKLWIEHINTPEYKPDPTVINHFYPIELEELFKNAGFKIITAGQFGQCTGGVNERLFLEAQI